MKMVFLAFEREAVVLARLAQRFKEKGHEVLLVSCDHYFVTHDWEHIPQICRSAGLSETEFTNLSDVFRQVNELSEELSTDDVDWQYLRKFENSYGRTFTVHDLIATDPLLSGAYHHRNIYYRPANKAILFKCIEVHLKWLEAIFKERDVDAIITLNNQYFTKAAAYSIAQGLAIPFLVVTSCRIRDLFLIYDNFCLSTPASVQGEMHRLETTRDPCPDGESFISNLNEYGIPAWTDAGRWNSNLQTTLSLRWRLGYIWSTLKRSRTAFKIRRYRGLLKRDYFLPSYGAMLKVLIVNMMRRIAFFHHPEFFEAELPKAPFVFFPLHLIPESTILSSSRTLDEMECVYQVSRLVPPDWKVVVKVNINMLGHLDSHPSAYYLDMHKIPNVQFIDPRILSPAIIARSSAVACISGTALLEGAALGKPSFRWGHADYEAVDSIHEFDPKTFRSHLLRSDVGNVKYYIQACFNLGMRLDYDFVLLMKETCSSPEEQCEYDVQMDRLENGLNDSLRAASAARAPHNAELCEAR